MKKVLPLLIFFFACQKSQTQPEPPREVNYDSQPTGMSLSRTLKESSGITYSNTFPDYLWVNQDSGNPPLIYLMKSDGTVQDSLLIEGAVNRDWEDLTIGSVPGSGKTNLFIADIGDNNAQYPECVIYRLSEPAAGVTSISQFDRIAYKYEDGPRDAEALIVDDNSGDIYIITKRELKSRLYRLSYPQSISEINEARFLMELPYNNVVSAAISFEGEEVLVKTYTEVHHYSKSTSQTIDDVLSKSPHKTLGYQLEPQGEAITFAKDGSGFYTLSEEAMGIVPKLYFYRRK